VLLTTSVCAGATGIRGDLLARLDTIESKIVGLAEAMPAEKYTWRPMEGVRSVSELFMHVASANYRIPSMIGASIPDGIDARGLEKSTTDKAKIVPTLKASFQHLKTAVENVNDADLEKSVKLFGRDSNYRGVLLLITEHLSEHLGQGIAYARTNQVKPPWSR
jgi:uncharacterized damage-inducible protein DinB